MVAFHPLFLTLVALIFTLIHPTASQPIRTPKWIKKDQFEDPQGRGVWKVFEKEGTTSAPQLPQAQSGQTPQPMNMNMNMNLNHEDPTIERGPPEYRYKRDSSSGKSIVSVLIPVSPASAHHHHHHHAQDKQQQDAYTYARLESLAAHKSSSYSELLGLSQGQSSELHEDESTSTSTSTPTSTTFSSAALKLASGDSISFFSYRIPLPFLKFAPSSFPFQPPDVFTTVLVLLAMVWIAILMIALVEFGNYLWKRRRADRLAARCERDMGDDLAAGAVELVKVPFPGSSNGTSMDEDAALLERDVNRV